MFDVKRIKGIIFDYGGTIDSNGVHWSEVIYKSYEALQIPVDKKTFREAYIRGERALARQQSVLPDHNFWHVLKLKAEAQIQWLAAHRHLPADDRLPDYAAGIADWCYTYAQTAINAARPILKKLSERYPLCLITNFYGNMESVLEDYYLSEFFGTVIESAAVGIRKPDPAIYKMGIERFGLNPAETAVVGDSYSKDILPASGLGCQTIWLKNTGWNGYTGNEAANIIISDFPELQNIFRFKDTLP
ncbi:MAG: HAD family hydrolase [Bacteroidales bacterium]